VGDFVWSGFDDETIARDEILTAFRAHFSGFELGPVEMIEDPEMPLPERRKPRVRLPYEGPPLSELWVTSSARLDRGRSSVELERKCRTCSTEYWEVYGVEHWESHYDPDGNSLIRSKTERHPGAGIFVDESQLAGADLFRLREFPSWIFCTDSVREFVEKQSYSNVAFLEMGSTF
jgi:hypothetical protein